MYAELLIKSTYTHEWLGEFEYKKMQVTYPLTSATANTANKSLKRNLVKNARYCTTRNS